jgi:hypothetical protein
MSKKLTDESLMPFGKWKDTKMANVPDQYLRWIFGEKWLKKNHPHVWRYIKDNEDVIFNSGECDATESDIY